MAPEEPEAVHERADGGALVSEPAPYRDAPIPTRAPGRDTWGIDLEQFGDWRVALIAIAWAMLLAVDIGGMIGRANLLDYDGKQILSVGFAVRFSILTVLAVLGSYASLGVVRVHADDPGEGRPGYSIAGREGVKLGLGFTLPSLLGLVVAFLGANPDLAVRCVEWAVPMFLAGFLFLARIERKVVS